MKKNLVLLILLYLLKNVNSSDSKLEADNVGFKNVHDLGDNPNNFKPEKFELKSFYGNEESINQKNAKKCEEFIQTVDSYVQRYVSLFLITSNLMNHEIKNLNEMIDIELDISIAAEDLDFLQNYSKGRIDPAYPRNLSKLNDIFSKIAKLKEKSYIEKAMNLAKNSFFRWDYRQLFHHPNFHYLAPFFTILAVSFMIYYFSFNISFYICITIILNSMILWESLRTYWKRLKEADVELYVKTLHSSNIPNYCNPENMYWYHSLKNYLFGNNCLQYYKDLNKVSVEEVSFFQCVIDTYGLYLIQTPFKIFGASVRVFTDEVTGSWPFPLSLLKTPMTPAFVIIFCLFILILLGKGFKFSFFGASVEMGRNQSVPLLGNRGALPNQTLRIIKDSKKIRLTPKSRFPRRLQLEKGIRRNSLNVCKNCENHSNDVLET